MQIISEPVHGCSLRFLSATGPCSRSNELQPRDGGAESKLLGGELLPTDMVRPYPSSPPPCCALPPAGRLRLLPGACCRGLLQSLKGWDWQKRSPAGISVAKAEDVATA